MFISTLLLIPWFRFGFKHPDNKFLGLNQTPKSLSILVVTELFFFLILHLLLPDPNPNVAGQGDFGWTYMFVYAKGIFPIIGLMQISDPTFHELGNYTASFLISALLVDYILLFLISPRTLNKILKGKKKNTNAQQGV